ncbi:MAG: ribosome silencing factor [Opitutales bacterium]
MPPAKKKPSARKPAARKPVKKKPARPSVVRTARKPAVPRARGRSSAVTRRDEGRIPAPPPYVVAAVRALDDKKGEAIRVLRLGQLSSVADWLIVCTGTSEPHLRALRIELERSLEEAGSRPRGVESHKDSGWTVVDAFDAVIHIFREAVRRDYALESLWKDGLDVPVAAILKT